MAMKISNPLMAMGSNDAADLGNSTSESDEEEPAGRTEPAFKRREDEAEADDNASNDGMAEDREGRGVWNRYEDGVRVPQAVSQRRPRVAASSLRSSSRPLLCQTSVPSAALPVALTARSLVSVNLLGQRAAAPRAAQDREKDVRIRRERH